VLAELDTGVTSLAADLERLIDREIVKEAPAGNELTLHPLDGRFLMSELSRDPRREREGHLALARYYHSLRKPAYRGLEDVEPNLRELHHLKCAQDFSAALTVLDEIDFDYLSIWGESDLLLRERQKLPDEALTQNERGRNWLGIGAAFAELGEPAKALSQYERALVAAAGDEQLLVRIRLLMGMARIHTGSFARARETLEKVIQQADALGSERELGRAYSGHGLALVGLGQYEEGIASYKKALEIGRKLDPRGVVRRLTNLGVVHLHLGEPDLAAELFGEALVRARNVGDARGEGRLFIYVARTNEYFGRIDDALHFHELARERAKIVDDVTGTGNNEIARATLLRQLGQLTEAIAAAERALLTARDTRLARLEAEALSVRGQILLDQWYPEAAEEAFREALRLAGTEMPRERGAALTGLARLASQRGEWQTAYDGAAEAIAQAGAMTPSAAAAGVIRMRALLHLELPFVEESAAGAARMLGVRTEMALLRALVRSLRTQAMDAAGFEEARDLAEELLRASGGTVYAASYILGIAAAVLGDEERAIAKLQEARARCSAPGVLQAWRDVAAVAEVFDGGVARRQCDEQLSQPPHSEAPSSQSGGTAMPNARS
jgi:tetratricopeptide (TPR) repeat protein